MTLPKGERPKKEEVEREVARELGACYQPGGFVTRKLVDARLALAESEAKRLEEVRRAWESGWYSREEHDDNHVSDETKQDHFAAYLSQKQTEKNT